MAVMRHGDVTGPGRRRLVAGVGIALVLLVVASSVPSGAASTPAAPLPPTYPDLVPDVQSVRLDRPIVGFDPVTFTNIYGPLHVYFDTWSQNLGTVPVDLLVDNPTDLARTTVSQCVAWVGDLACAERAPVGGVVWHDEHRHFHFEGFARYELRRLRPNGRVNYSERGLVARSDKVSFCLMDTATVREDALPVQRYSSCTPAQQGISPGWADIYFDGLAGQQLPIEGLADGRYALVIALNPSGGLYETDHANNRVEAILELSGGLTQVSITERRWSS